jgi:hypothetical protein
MHGISKSLSGRGTSCVLQRLRSQKMWERKHSIVLGPGIALQIAGSTVDFDRLKRVKSNQKWGDLIEST